MKSLILLLILCLSGCATGKSNIVTDYKEVENWEYFTRDDSSYLVHQAEPAKYCMIISGTAGERIIQEIQWEEIVRCTSR